MTAAFQGVVDHARVDLGTTGTAIEVPVRGVSPGNRGHFLRRAGLLGATVLAAQLLWSAPLLAAPAAEAAKPARKIPVILDTDIGDDIDDTWALGFLLKSPELDLKLAVGDYGKQQYRARLLAKLLQTAGHASVPIGLGLDIDPRGEGPQAAWVKDYDLKTYPGKVHPDGVQAIIDTVMKSREPVTIISIGPMPNIAEVLKREPGIAKRARLAGMYGSVRRGYDADPTPAPEWNVKAAPDACRAAFAAPWDKMTITPLDTCGVVKLDGDLYRQVRDSRDPIAAAIMENYRLWSKAGNAQNDAAENRSSVLFDTVAVYLAFSQDLCRMEQLGLNVTADGFTRLDEQARKLNVATEWKDLPAFQRLLVDRLTQGKAGHSPRPTKISEAAPIKKVVAPH